MLDSYYHGSSRNRVTEGHPTVRGGMKEASGVCYVRVPCNDHYNDRWKSLYSKGDYFRLLAVRYKGCLVRASNIFETRGRCISLDRTVSIHKAANTYKSGHYRLSADRFSNAPGTVVLSSQTR